MIKFLISKKTLKFFRKKWVPTKHLRYLVLDTETGGLSEKDYDILSIGYVVTNKSLRVLTKGEILIKADPSRVSEEALKVNGINLEEHNAVAYTAQQAAAKLDLVVTKYWKEKKPTIIGQNIPFDVKFVKTIFEGTGMSFTPHYKSIDLRTVWQLLLALGKVSTPDSKQDTILDYLGIESKGKRHTALTDAENVLRILKEIKKHINKF